MLSGNKLMFLRIRHNHSQQYIADCIGVSREYISMIENSRKPMTENIYDKYIDAIYGKLLPPKKEDNINDNDKTVDESTETVSDDENVVDENTKIDSDTTVDENKEVAVDETGIDEMNISVIENVVVEQPIESIETEPKKPVKKNTKAKGE